MASFTTQDGTELFFKDWGSGRPVVFSHGWPLNADAWESQMRHLAGNGFRTIAMTGAAMAGRPRPSAATTCTPMPTTWCS